VYCTVFIYFVVLYHSILHFIVLYDTVLHLIACALLELPILIELYYTVLTVLYFTFHTFIVLLLVVYIIKSCVVLVSDGKSLGQPSCQREWKNYKEEDE
jgi:hypothetical protein